MARDSATTVPQIKGVAMLNAVRALRSMDKARARELLPPSLHKYLEDERVLPVVWYPEAEMLELNRALAQLIRPTLRGASLEQTFVHMGRLVGDIDLSGPYASLQRGGISYELVQRMSDGWKQYHDTGTLDASLEGEQRARFELRDFGLPSRELCWIQRGWFLAFVERTTRSEQVTVVHSQCRTRGSPTCVWEARWS